MGLNVRHHIVKAGTSDSVPPAVTAISLRLRHELEGRMAVAVGQMIAAYPEAQRESIDCIPQVIASVNSAAVTAIIGSLRALAEDNDAPMSEKTGREVFEKMIAPIQGEIDRVIYRNSNSDKN